MRALKKIAIKLGSIVYDMRFFVICFFIALGTITVFWQWLEFTYYGEIKPSKEDSTMSIVMAWLIADKFRRL